MKRFLIIQTAFIGDVVLATGIVEKLHQYYPDAQIDFMLRKGNEGLLAGHPFLNKVYVWDKKQGKYKNLFSIIGQIRKEKYDMVINLQRFAASGIVTVLSGAKEKYGYDKNPLSAFFSRAFPHEIGKKGDVNYKHEIARNHAMIAAITDAVPARPVLHPSALDLEAVAAYKSEPYITIAPASVWFTKQYPKEQWAAFIRQLPVHIKVYLTGGKGDASLCEEIMDRAGKNPNIINLAGKLNFLQSAALMKDAKMNYTNDSAPLHFASAMNAAVTAVFCSTIPEFGFGPLSDDSRILQIDYNLECRPCGLHGYKACPLGHFKCAYDIKTASLNF